jgi:tRNA nucleotidyltransferase (CCA-adding enzyme)
MTDVRADVHPPGAVKEIVRTLQRAGYETWCVGGAVRDALLGHAHLDWDLATAATPNQVRRLFDRTVPVGIEFGTVGVLDGAGYMHEVTTFRRDVQHDGRHAVVEFGASLDEDLARRDFTINAIAFDPSTGRLHDPFDGRADLAARVVRAVGDPDARMLEDRLRALRALRFAARFRFELDPATWSAIVASAPFLSRLSPERVKQEIEKTMEQVRQPSRAFRQWRDSGAFASLVPALASVGDDVLAAVDCLPLPNVSTRPQRRVLRVATLLSDLAPRDAEQAVRQLRFSNSDIAWIVALVDRWHRAGSTLSAALGSDAGMADRAVRRLAADVGRLRVGAFMRLASARWASAREAAAREATAREAAAGAPDASARAMPRAPTAARVRSLHRRLTRAAFRQAIEIADLAIDGDDLRQAGVRPGPLMGQLLAQLLEVVLDDPAANTRESLLARVASRQASL